MKSFERIPLVIGVTGHRNLREDQIPVLTDIVRKEIRRIRQLCPSSPVLVLSGLAEGADQLCARIALEEGCFIEAALPMALEEYEKDFSGQAFKDLHDLCGKARQVFVVPETEPHREGRDFLYRQEGIYVARHCQVLLALWDGKPGTGYGCGTAETIDFRRYSSFDRDPECSLQNPDRPLIWIRTGRKGAGPGDTPEMAGEPVLPQVIRYGDEGLTRSIEAVETFNIDAGRESKRLDGEADLEKENHLSDAVGQEKEKNLSGAADQTGSVPGIQAVYQMADTLSIHYSGLHRKTIAALSVAATLLTMAFLLYDEMNLHWMSLICILMVLSLFAINHLADRMLYHRKFMEYRLLAEGIRVQTYLMAAGLRTEVTDLLPWSWQLNVPWVRDALAAIMIGSRRGTDRRESIKEIWIDDQKQYHMRAFDRLKKQNETNRRILGYSLFITIFSYMVCLAFELIPGGLFTGRPLLEATSLEAFRTFLKILMGSLSAATLFAANYYGKLSLDESMADHKRMIALYEMAEREIEETGLTEAFLCRLAREELNENSGWYAYQSNNKPEIGI